MSAALVLSRVEGAVAILTLNRPERRNALSPELVAALLDAFAAAGADSAVRAVVLTGAGDKSFCAGGDLGGGMMAEGAHEAWRGRGRFADLLLAMHRLGKPIIAAVQGDALGGGFGLAMGCDMVVVAAEARLGTPEIKVGLFPMIILAELIRNVPRKALSEMIYTGRYITPEEARAWGLVNRVVPKESVLASALELASAVARHSPAVLKLGKDAVNLCEDLAFEPALRLLHGQLEANLMTEDAMEGIGAFLARREPEWRGR